jgi:hypothetical protein
MRGSRMDIDWRTLQLFLDDVGVAEVEADADNYQTMKCSCPVFSRTKKCKHVRHVRKHMDEHDGTYSIQIPEDVPEEVVTAAMLTKESFRELIVKYSIIEVI